jgi:hypothetical protein
MFLGLLVPDPDPLVRGTDPDPSFVMQNTGSYKNEASKSSGSKQKKTFKRILLLSYKIPVVRKM